MDTDTHSESNVLEIRPRGQKSAIVEKVEKRSFILTLRRRGMSWQQISDALLKERGEHMDPSSVAQAVKRYLDHLNSQDAETAEELRVLENERLDELLAIWGPRARQGDHKAAQIVLKISDQRAKLNGLNSAKRVEHHHTGSLVHELGTDPAEIAREREAWLTASGVDGDIIDAEPIPND